MKHRKFAYLTEKNINKVEDIKEKYGTTFSGALNIILSNSVKQTKI